MRFLLPGSTGTQVMGRCRGFGRRGSELLLPKGVVRCPLVVTLTQGSIPSLSLLPLRLVVAGSMGLREVLFALVCVLLQGRTGSVRGTSRERRSASQLVRERL